MSDGGSGRRGRWLWWAAVLAWALVILAFSGNEFSAAATSRFIGPLLLWLFPDAPELRETLHSALRKLAHPIEYGILAALAFRAARRSRLTVRLAAAVSVGLVLALAIADESRQATLSMRTGSPHDVALDLAGGGLALLLVLALRAARRAARRTGQARTA